MERGVVGMLLATAPALYVLLSQTHGVAGLERRQFDSNDTTFGNTSSTTFSSTVVSSIVPAGTAPTGLPRHDIPTPNSWIYSETESLRTFALTTIALLIVNALLLISLIIFIALIYFKRLPLSYPRSGSSSSSTIAGSSAGSSEVGTVSMISRGTLATPSIDGTVQRALKGRTIPSHHYPTRSWDRVPTIASTSTESARRRRKRPVSASTDGYGYAPVAVASGSGDGSHGIGFGSSDGSYPTQSGSSGSKGGYGEDRESVSIIESGESGLDPFRDSSITSGSAESGYSGSDGGEKRGMMGARY